MLTVSPIQRVATRVDLLQNYLFAADAQSGFGRRLTLRSLIFMRLLWPFVLYFFISVRQLLHTDSPQTHMFVAHVLFIEFGVWRSVCTTVSRFYCFQSAY